jgi:microsomal dipeptidase-like Zn-dependent dipeptidase
MSPGVLASLGGWYAPLVNQIASTSQTLVGLVDLHTHPAAHMGFGREVFYGPPEGDMSQLFNSCNGFHGGPGIDNTEGNLIRQQVVNGITSQEYSLAYNHYYSGYPTFPAWPTWHDRLHQQARAEMLERAWQGGLRLIVALAVTSHTLAKVSQTMGPYDDKSAGDSQIDTITSLTSDQSFMDLCLSPADVRKTIGAGNLAVVIGVELDCVGNFYVANDPGNCSAPFQPAPSDEDIIAEINRLYSKGVRYFFPVHLIDNLFGGAALYEMAFDTANRYEFGSFYAAEPAPASSKITYRLVPPETFWGQVVDVPNVIEAASLGFDPQGYPPVPLTSTGHRNSRGLQHQGMVALNALMNLGAMIDVDHMGENTVLGTLSYTGSINYPLFAGHNTVRGGTPGITSERAHQIQVVTEILNRGGMFGIGTKGGLPTVASTIAELRKTTSSGGVALGSDCSGMEQLPAPRNAQDVVYRGDVAAPASALAPFQLGEKWYDINTDGFAHIGMYPDFLEDGVCSGLLTHAAVTELFNAPEAFATAWESCLRLSAVNQNLRHTMRLANGSWTGNGSVNGEFAIPLQVAAVSAAFDGVSGVTQFMFTTSDGHLWHTMRLANGSWTGLGDVNAQFTTWPVQSGPGPVHAVSATFNGVGGQTQFMFATDDGGLWHTMRLANGSWTGLGNVNEQFAIPGPVSAVSAAYDGVSGETQFMFTTVGGGLWHTMRLANGSWTGLGDVNDQFAIPGPVAVVSATGDGEPGQTQFMFATEDGRLWHTMRLANGSWTGAGSVESQFALPGPVAAVSAAYDGVVGETQFMFTTNNGHLWHTIRHADGSWSGLGDMNDQFAIAGPVSTVSATGDGVAGETQFMFTT